MRSSRFLVLALAAALLSPLLRADVYVTNNTPCTTLMVMIKQYVLYDGWLDSCPAWEEPVAYGATLSITNELYSYYEPDAWGNMQYHSREIRYEPQYTYSVAASCPCPEVASVQAQDTDHPGRVAGTGGTLYLVGENSATISATSAGGSFGPNCPQWSGGYTGTGQQFINTDASDASYTAGGKTVNVVRKQTGNISYNPGSLDMLQWKTKAETKFRFPGCNTSFSASINMGSTSVSAARAEKYNNPNSSYKFTITAGYSGSISGRIVHPTLSHNWGFAKYEVYADAGLSLGTSGSVAFDPSKENPWTANNPTLSLTGNFKIGVDAWVDIGWYEARGSLAASTSLTGEARLSGPEIQLKVSWTGVVGTVNVKIWSDPANPILDINSSYTLWEGDSTDWEKIYSINDPPENPS
ncbi:MAG: hypothetical protein ACOZE5_00160 [Verrucomicrobiota bacterium]